MVDPSTTTAARGRLADDVRPLFLILDAGDGVRMKFAYRDWSELLVALVIEFDRVVRLFVCGDSDCIVVTAHVDMRKQA